MNREKENKLNGILSVGICELMNSHKETAVSYIFCWPPMSLGIYCSLNRSKTDLGLVGRRKLQPRKTERIYM